MRAIFVMIKCEMGQAYKVAREAADTIEQMSELYSTSGQYDLLGKFYLDPEQDIGLFVTEKVQSLPGVKDTYTLITFNAFGGGRAYDDFRPDCHRCDHLLERCRRVPGLSSNGRQQGLKQCPESAAAAYLPVPSRHSPLQPRSVPRPANPRSP